MTEKRFTIFGEWHKDKVIDEIRDNTGEFVTIGRCVDLLNELNTDNEVLMQRNTELGQRITYLEQKNQDIKNTIHAMMENERTHIGYNVLKQLMEAIN